MNKVLEKLSGGDLRSEGRAAEAADEIINNPNLLTDLVKGLHSHDKVIRARTCMAMEVVSRKRTELLSDAVPQLIQLASGATVPQVRWHIAEILGNVRLSDDQAERMIPILLEWLRDKSKIVKYCAVQALGILGRDSPSTEQIVSKIVVLRGEGKSLDKAVAHALLNLSVE